MEDLSTIAFKIPCNKESNKMIEITSCRKLCKEAEVNSEPMHSSLENRIVLKFSSQEEIHKFEKGFIYDYLIPRYGLEEALNFPLVRTGPDGNWTEVVSDYIGMKNAKTAHKQEIWLVVPADRFQDIKKYLRARY